MSREKIARIIFAKILEMSTERYLAYIERATTLSRPARRDQKKIGHGSKKNFVYAKVRFRTGRLCFQIMDPRLEKTFPIEGATDDRQAISLKWINTRNRFSGHILRSLLRYQHRYFAQGRESALKPLSFKQFVSLYPIAYLDETRVSRLVPNLLIETPQGQIISLRNLFLSKRRSYAFQIKELIEQSEEALKDRDIQRRFAEKGVSLSLRTICYCRKLLSIPHYKQRASHYYGKHISFSGYLTMSEKKFSRIPAEPGVYELSLSHAVGYRKHRSDVIYIGSSRNLQKRIANYSGKSKLKNGRLARLTGHGELFVRYCVSERHRALEDELLKSFKISYGELPKANIVGESL